MRVAKYFYATNTPFNAASNVHYVDLFSSMRPGYTPPNRQAIAGNLLEACFEEYEKEFEENLEKKCFDFDITLMQDGWSSTSNDPILANSIFIGMFHNS